MDEDNKLYLFFGVICVICVIGAFAYGIITAEPKYTEAQHTVKIIDKKTMETISTQYGENVNENGSGWFIAVPNTYLESNKLISVHNSDYFVTFQDKTGIHTLKVDKQTYNFLEINKQYILIIISDLERDNITYEFR